MRWNEIIDEAQPRKPVKPSTADKPLTPAQSRTRADKQNKAAAKLSDTKAKAAIDVAAAQRKLTEL